MRISRYTLLPLFISIIFFIIPFFWLKPGEMDLGGDSSRLYFYDPLSYLLNHTFYSISSSGMGGENISYYGLPFISLILFLKFILNSSTVTISFFNGVSLSIAFLFSYLSIKELLQEKNNVFKKYVKEYSAILGGVLYVFFPGFLYGWDKVILTHNQIFLNPLMFYLLLMFITKRNKKFMYIFLLISFIFSPNFSYVAAPPFFAFYPLSFLFIVIYTKYVKKTSVPVKELVWGGLLFFMIQAFHLGPQLNSILSSGTSSFIAVFSEEAKLSRGLSYFTAIAQEIKVSINILNLPQMTPVGLIKILFVIFPLIIVIGLVLNRSKTVLLTGLFFLIALFFASANITNLGLEVYKSLFILPGFSMFRNFYGQWQYVFLFFYALLFGQCLAIILSKLKRYHYSAAILTSLVIIIIISAWPFIDGSLVNKILWQTKNKKIAIKMDPQYEKALKAMKKLPIDGKILTLPMSDPGYQIISGSNGGSYQGPSTISYLTGKKDFAGFTELGPFSDSFLLDIKQNNYKNLETIFQMLNIKYVFYNSDPLIYDDTFPSFPYDHVKNFLPENQKEYKELIKKLPLEEKLSIENKFHVYEVNNKMYLPHIYAVQKATYISNNFLFLRELGWLDDKPFAFLSVDDFDGIFTKKNFQNDQDLSGKADNIILEASNTNPVLDLKNNYHLHVDDPFSSRSLNNIFYPFVVLKESFELKKAAKNPDKYIGHITFRLSKRVAELRVWGGEINVLHQKWTQPKIWEFYKWNSYNSWEANLTRYKKDVEYLISYVSSINKPSNWKSTTRIIVKEQLQQHQLKLLRAINQGKKSKNDKRYLLTEVNQIFGDLLQKLQVDNFTPTPLTYQLNTSNIPLGEYEIYLKKDSTLPEVLNGYLEVEGKPYKPIETILENPLVKMGTININKANKIPIKFYFTPKNLINDIYWQPSGEVSKITVSTGALLINNVLSGNSDGLIKQIHGWSPDTQYLISFDYVTYGDEFIFKFYDKRFDKKEKKILGSNLYFEKLLNSQNWKHHQSIFTSDRTSASAFMQVISNNEKNTSRIDLKNVTIFPVSNPQILLKKIMPSNPQKISPKIVFTKINPAKYNIQVSQATSPYILVLLDGYNKNWKVYLKENSSDDNLGRTYFDGDTMEGRHKNSFINSSTFETWGKQTIADKKHFVVNGYANAWYIDSKETKGRKSYDLILEYKTQKFFYIYLLFSLIGVGIVVVFLVRSLAHEK